jgi:hypothetical protein
VLRTSDGALAIRRNGRGRARGEVVETLSSEFQRTVLECALPGDERSRATIAGECLAEVVAELRQVLPDREKLFGHCVLVHGLVPDRAARHQVMREQHRDAHRAGDKFAGHQVVAPRGT